MKFGNLFRSMTNSKSKFPWLLRHGRAYYASFYFATGVALILWSIGFFTGGTIVTGLAFASFFASAFLITGLVMMFLGATVSKENSNKRWRTRVKKVALASTAFLVLARGITAAVLTPYGFAFALITPVWIAFVILWAAPMIWYLPTEIDEFLALRSRLDETEREQERVTKELERLKVQRLREESLAHREQKSK